MMSFPCSAGILPDSVSTFLGTQVRKRILLRHFYGKNDHFTKTGAAQT
jgi:hypothetical protein